MTSERIFLGRIRVLGHASFLPGNIFEEGAKFIISQISLLTGFLSFCVEISEGQKSLRGRGDPRVEETHYGI